MAASPKTRWVCPQCDDRVMGPQRPRRDNIVRYCLPCSKQTGKLVERTAPVLEKRRAEQAAKAKAKRDAKAKREAQREHDRTHLTFRDSAGRLVEVNPVEAVRRIAQAADMRVVPVTWNRRSDGQNSGRAWSGRIHLSIGSKSLEAFCALVAHELGHVLAGAGAGHSDRWRDAYEEIVKANWNVNGPYRGGVTHHRYAIDPEIERSLGYESENPKRKKPLIGKVVGSWHRVEEKSKCSAQRCVDGVLSKHDCARCKTTGRLPAATVTVCPSGRGANRIEHWPERECDTCDGRGFLPERDCGWCKGTGIETRSTIKHVLTS